MTLLNKSGLLRRCIAIFTVVLLLCAQPVASSHDRTQTRRRKRVAVKEKRPPAEKTDFGEGALIDRAITLICEERVRDPLGSIPIDQMAAQHALPLTDSRVIAGRKRAERLLPAAKRLVPIILGRLAAAYNLEALSHDWINTRVRAVNTIKPDEGALDNSYWRPNEPNAITFGTIFLAGLRSDEAMIAVLAHELTHAVNGSDEALQPLFARVGGRASQVEKVSIRESMAAELTCEAVGIQVMRALSKGTIRPLARAVGKNCVQTDLADATHLSPRETMRVLLALDPVLLRTITVAQGAKRPRRSSD